MSLRKVAPLVCAAAALLVQSCVVYAPPEEAPPPQPYPAQPQTPPQVSYPSSPQPTPISPAEASALEELVAPVALYPDPLLSLILPASTLPDQVSAASASLAQYGNLRPSADRVWDGSIAGLAHYPLVIEWMAQNLAWTEAVGHAFSTSPAAVMDAVQRVRGRALASGRLHSGPQQTVVTENGEIVILPAQQGAIFVPSYDAEALMASDPYYGGDTFEDFGPAYGCGEWLSLSIDWRDSFVWNGGGTTWLSNGAWRTRTPMVATANGGQRWKPASIPPAPVQRPTLPRSGPAPGARGPGSGSPIPRPASPAVTPLPRPRVGGETTTPTGTNVTPGVRVVLPPASSGGFARPAPGAAPSHHEGSSAPQSSGKSEEKSDTRAEPKSREPGK
jgi:hypothetical protein